MKLGRKQTQSTLQLPSSQVQIAPLPHEDIINKWRNNFPDINFKVGSEAFSAQGTAFRTPTSNPGIINIKAADLATVSGEELVSILGHEMGHLADPFASTKRSYTDTPYPLNHAKEHAADLYSVRQTEGKAGIASYFGRQENFNSVAATHPSSVHRISTLDTELTSEQLHRIAKVKAMHNRAEWHRGRMAQWQKVREHTQLTNPKDIVISANNGPDSLGEKSVKQLSKSLKTRGMTQFDIAEIEDVIAYNKERAIIGRARADTAMRTRGIVPGVSRKETFGMSSIRNTARNFRSYFNPIASSNTNPLTSADTLLAGNRKIDLQKRVLDPNWKDVALKDEPWAGKVMNSKAIKLDYIDKLAQPNSATVSGIGANAVSTASMRSGRVLKTRSSSSLRGAREVAQAVTKGSRGSRALRSLGLRRLLG